VAGELGGDGAAPGGGKLAVFGAGPEQGAQVCLGGREQAVADLPVGGQPDPVACSAEWPGDRADHADAAGAAVDQERLGASGAPAARVAGGQREPISEAGEDLAGGNHVGAPPAVLSVEGYLLDEAELVAAVQAEPEQAGSLVVVDAGTTFPIPCRTP
jgi:hypothetical protein